MSKICVSIGRGRHKHLLADHRFAVEQGADLCELRLDYVLRTVDLRRILDNRPGPIVLTIRRERDGGRWTGDEEARRMILRQAIVAGVEYVDLEEDVATAIPRYGKTKRIISFHDFNETPADLDGLYARMATRSPDIIKIATKANTVEDVFRLWDLARRATVPTIAIGMGEIGVPTRILAGKYGAPFTFAVLSAERTLAPGQLPLRTLREVYRYERITPETAVYGVIADPVGHSLSPVVHNAVFRHEGLASVYVPFRIPTDDLFTFLRGAPGYDIRGLSVTIPHKERAVSFINGASAAVKGIGACNTVIYESPEYAVGHNTDYRAAMEALGLHKGDAEEGNVLAGKTALLLGSGGVCRAIGYGLKKFGADVVVAGRDPTRRDILCQQLGCRGIAWSDRHDIECDVLVNGTPMGMHPNVNETPYAEANLHPRMTVFDTVYNPEQTLLVKHARTANCRVVTGVEMFIRQAQLQYKYFTGHRPPGEVMATAFRDAISAAR